MLDVSAPVAHPGTVLVHKMLDRVSTHGLGGAVDTVRARVANDRPTGYSCVGTVIESGPPDLAPGDRVVVLGLGFLGPLTVKLLRTTGCVVLVGDVPIRRQRDEIRREEIDFLISTSLRGAEDAATRVDNYRCATWCADEVLGRRTEAESSGSA